MLQFQFLQVTLNIAVDTLDQGPDYVEDESIEEREKPIKVPDTIEQVPGKKDDTADIAGYYPDHIDHQPRHDVGWLAGLDPPDGQDIAEEQEDDAQHFSNHQDKVRSLTVSAHEDGERVEGTKDIKTNQHFQNNLEEKDSP